MTNCAIFCKIQLTTIKHAIKVGWVGEFVGPGCHAREYFDQLDGLEGIVHYWQDHKEIAVIDGMFSNSEPIWCLLHV